MRANGVDERYITGDAGDYEKFEAWAGAVEQAVGNPLYHWSHLELRRYFGYTGTPDGGQRPPGVGALQRRHRRGPECA